MFHLIQLVHSDNNYWAFPSPSTQKKTNKYIVDTTVEQKNTRTIVFLQGLFVVERYERTVKRWAWIQVETDRNWGTRNKRPEGQPGSSYYSSETAAVLMKTKMFLSKNGPSKGEATRRPPAYLFSVCVETPLDPIRHWQTSQTTLATQLTC